MAYTEYDGATSAAELDKLAGLTAVAAKLNYNDITILGKAEPSKVLTADSDGNFDMDGAKVSNVNIVSYQGLAWNESTDAYTRRGSLTGLATSQSPGNDFLPVQRQLRRCVLSAAGEVQYYLDPDDSTLKVNGDAANLDGTDGQVMVEIPRFYIRNTYAANVHTWDISLQPLNGFTIHPAFNPRGELLDHIYVSAYEGVAYDNGASAYNDGAGAAASNWNGGAIDTANDKLGSVSGFKPVTDETRAEFRSVAGNVGSGWELESFWVQQAKMLLFLIEYGSFNSQAMIGNGNTSYDAFDYDNNVGDTGYSNGDGNGTNGSDTTEDGLTTTDPNDGTTNKEYMTYRGIENFYGNVWISIDGLNIHNFDDNAGTAYSRAYAANDVANFADDTDTDYDAIGDLVESGGYQKTLVDAFGAFLPATVGATSTTWITDYYYTRFDNLTPAFDGWQVPLVGGRAADGSRAGAFALDTKNDSAHDGAGLGARLTYRKP